MKEKTTFYKHWKSLASVDKRVLAKKSKTSVDYLSQIANGHRNAGASMIERLMKADSSITFRMMRETTND